jgi:hypothetical protein
MVIPSAQAASTAVTGNAKAIAFYKVMVKTTARYGGVVMSRVGYDVLKSTISGTFSTYYNLAVVPTGFSPAKEMVTLALSGGKTVWVADLMTPKCGASGSCGTNIPIRLLLNSKGEFYQLRAPSRPSSCWGTATSVNVGGFMPGTPAYETIGHFDPMKRVGKNETVTSTFPWSNKRTATEVDTISLATHLPIRSVVKVPKEGATPAYSFTWTNAWLKTAPIQPKVTMCS